jgi:hypothetical protein
MDAPLDHILGYGLLANICGISINTIMSYWLIGDSMVEDNTKGLDNVPRVKECNKVYVTMTDRFMSGWGCAANKTNKLVIACDTMQEAETVARNAETRSEMRYINICMNRPRYDSKRYTVSEHDKTDYPGWFEVVPPWRK